MHFKEKLLFDEDILLLVKTCQHLKTTQAHCDVSAVAVKYFESPSVAPCSGQGWRVC